VCDAEWNDASLARERILHTIVQLTRATQPSEFMDSGKDFNYLLRTWFLLGHPNCVTPRTPQNLTDGPRTRDLCVHPDR
jgi:hypothetical protein